LSTAKTRKNLRPELACQVENFLRHFQLSAARTPEQKLLVYRLRYNVYCKNFGFEDPRIHAQGFETDAFDDRSFHLLVTHRATGTPAGCVRLVTADRNDGLPLERHGAGALDLANLNGGHIRREKTAEISRLAVDYPFCRLRGEATTHRGGLDRAFFDEQEQKVFPLISVALFLAAGSAASLIGRPNCFALMEPFLQVMSRRLGIPLLRAGADFEYRGKRTPFYCNITEAEGSLPVQLFELYNRISCELAPSLSSGLMSTLPGNEARSQNTAKALSYTG